jgi:multimeric flavodoxin WrbA
MKKITAFIGTARKGHTFEAATIFLEDLKAMGGYETEVVMLGDCQVGTCKGCKMCFLKGEEFCPMKDDRDMLLGKMMASDGVVFATPNYMGHVSATMKLFIDRFGFIGHRPRFFGKTFTGIITQGIYGGAEILKYLDTMAQAIGFNTVKGSFHTSFDPMTDQDRENMHESLAGHSRRFHERSLKPAFPPPTLFRLMLFRMSRTAMRNAASEKECDYAYYSANGWFESPFYYPTRLGPLKWVAGKSFEWFANRHWPPVKKEPA